MRYYVVLDYNAQDEKKQLNMVSLHTCISSVFLAIESYVTQRDGQLTYLIAGTKDFQAYVQSLAESRGITNQVYQDLSALKVTEDQISELLNAEKPPVILAYYYLDSPSFAFGPKTVTSNLAEKYADLLKAAPKEMPEGDPNQVLLKVLMTQPKNIKPNGDPYGNIPYRPKRWSWALRTTSLRTRPDNRPLPVA